MACTMASHMTRAEAAAALGLSVHRLDQLRYAGTITTVRHGHYAVCVMRDSVSTELARRTEGVPVEYPRGDA